MPKAESVVTNAVLQLEDDPGLAAIEIWVNRTLTHSAEAKKYGVDGLLGIRERTALSFAALPRCADRCLFSLAFADEAVGDCRLAHCRDRPTGRGAARRALGGGANGQRHAAAVRDRKLWGGCGKSDCTGADVDGLVHRRPGACRPSDTQLMQHLVHL